MSKSGGVKSVKSARAKAAEALLDKHAGEIVSIGFVKRDSTYRLLNGRSGVKKGVKGVGMKYAPKERGLYPVFDMQKEEFRMANLNTATQIKAGGVSYHYDPTAGWVGSDGDIVPVEKEPERVSLYDFDPRVGF